MIATTYLALHHLNTRDTSIVKELDNIPDECFSTTSKNNSSSSSSSLLELVINQEALTTKRAAQIMIENATELCAFLGTYDPDVARAMQPTSEALDLPQVIYYTLDQFLTSSSRPSAIGLPPTVLPVARIIAEYLNTGQVIPPREYVQLIYEEAYTSSYFAQCFEEDAASKYGLESQKYQDDHLGIIPTMTPEEFQRKIMKEVKDSGVKTVFLNKMDSKSLNVTAHILADLNMLTNEYVYVFRSQIVPPDAVGTIFGSQHINSPLDLLLRGGLISDFIDPFYIQLHGGGDDDDDDDYDPFLRVWKQQNSTTVQQIRDQYPEVDTLFQDHDDYFQNNVPAEKSSFLYDAIISIGLGTCANRIKKNIIETTNETITTTLLSSTTFREDIRTYNFTGASGFVDWYNCKYKSNRCNEPIQFGIFNIRAVPVVVDDDTTMHTYEAVLTAKHDEVNRWQKINDNIYRDGTTSHPTNLRQEWDANYLSTGTRIFGFILFAIAFLCSVLCYAGVMFLREDGIIVRGQPFFLAILCVGSMITSCAIFTLGLDEQSFQGSISKEGLDTACMTSLWLFFSGQILSFTAVYCKLRRLDKVLTFRRIKVTAWKASLPLILFLTIASLVLIVWTVVDPWTWERQIVMLNPFETYGFCSCENFFAFFATLMGLLVLSMAMALFTVYKTADAADDYTNTKAIVLSLVVQLQSWLLGVPILAVLSNGDSSDAVFLSRALLIFVFSISALFEVIYKIYQALYRKSNPCTSSTSRITITGVRIPNDQSQSDLAHRRSKRNGSDSLLNVYSNSVMNGSHRSSSDHVTRMGRSKL